MPTIGPDGTLVQRPKEAYRSQLADRAFDQLVADDLSNYEDASQWPADPDWQRTQPPANRLRPEPGEWQYPCPIVDFTWHHVIPWNMLCGFWGALAREQRWQLLERFMSVLDI